MTLSRPLILIAIATACFGGIVVAHAEGRQTACVEITNQDPALLSPLGARYETEHLRVERQRGVSRCSFSNGRTSCLLSDPGRFRVTAGGQSRTFRAPLFAEVKLSVEGRAIRCERKDLL